MRIGALHIKFSSQFAFLYESVMALITQAVVDVFNQLLSKEIVNALVALGNQQLRDANPSVSYDNYVD